MSLNGESDKKRGTEAVQKACGGGGGDGDGEDPRGADLSWGRWGLRPAAASGPDQAQRVLDIANSPDGKM